MFYKDDIDNVFNGMSNEELEDIVNSDAPVLMHYGTPRHSGRYPWGSGENPYQHSGDFLARISELKSKGMTDNDIAKSMGLTTTQYRTQKSLAKDEREAEILASIKSLKADGLGATEIGRRLGIPEGTVRSKLNEATIARRNQARTTADFLRQQVDEKGMIDVGTGVERELNVSREKMREALYILEMEGYKVYGGGVPQITNPGKQTNLKVLCRPGTEHKDIYDYDKIQSVRDYVTSDDGETFHKKFVYPKSLDSKRLGIVYAEDGGTDKDGLMEIRRGCKDLDLGNSNYAQVRILVDGTHYLKGMAVYSDDLPDGIDIRFNTNKKKGTPVLGDDKNNTVLKKIKNDPDNPFGSLIKDGVRDPDNPLANDNKCGQSYYYDDNGKKQLSLINKRAEEGDWGEWGNKLPSQFLAKQNISLVKKQLGLSIEDKQMEFKDIMELTNPTVKKQLLNDFADGCDKAAIDLKAASLPRQKYQVIIPIKTINDNEIYAPNYNNGEKVALVRYPHGGTFEIPILTVNNKQLEAKKVLGNAMDAVGINSKVAERLSGADFDGDTVMVIPTNDKVKISSTRELDGLKGFDPKLEYPSREGMKVMKDTQKQMGVISNLITDMTIKGADEDELARAVRHSMVVIDAEKHHLDYKRSEAENGIAALKKKYQGHYEKDGSYHEGASTILSRAKSEKSVPKRQGSPTIDPNTGELTWKTSDDPYYIDKNGKKIQRTQQSTKMAEAKDARELVSGYPNKGHLVEEEYAKYANTMKTMANQARKEMLNTGKIAVNASAKNAYKAEVDSLDAKLNMALRNKPRERQAQTIANAIIAAKKRDNPDMTKKEIKKASQQALEASRAKVGAKRTTIKIEPREWEAIQSGAISEYKLTRIINNADKDVLKELATPRLKNELTTAKINKIKSMKNYGYTTAEIARYLGVSTSTVTKYLK